MTELQRLKTELEALCADLERERERIRRLEHENARLRAALQVIHQDPDEV